MREAWNWLVLRGYLMQNQEQPSPDLFVLTSAGNELLNRIKPGATPSDTVTSVKGGVKVSHYGGVKGNHFFA